MQGVALAARTLGCKAVICMPTNSPEIKINAVKELGGIVELVGESFYEVSRLGNGNECGRMHKDGGCMRASRQLVGRWCPGVTPGRGQSITFL